MVPRASFWHSQIPDCANAIVSWIEGEARPLPGLHGTGFFVKRNGRVAFITARHCLGSPDADYDDVVRRLAITYYGATSRPEGPSSHRDWVRFEAYAIPKVNWDNDAFFAEGDMDLAVMKISTADEDAARSLQARAAELPPTGEWLEKAFVFNGNQMMGHAIVRGFPKSGTETAIDYDTGTVVVQGVEFRGFITGRGDYPHTWRIEFENGSNIDWSLDGVSGAPVFVQWRSSDGRMEAALAGMMIRGAFPVGQFMDVSWYAEAMRQLGI